MQRESKEQNRHCKYNIILRRVSLPIVAVGKQYLLHFLCVSL